MYNIITFCNSPKFELILPHWTNRIKSKCTDFKISVLKITDDFVSKINLNYSIYAWWDAIRMTKVVELLEKNETVVHCDLDIIIQKDIKPLIDIDCDFIISQEIGENKAFPENCSSKLGFGVCTGFYIAKPTALPFLKDILNNMKNIKYDNTYSDQVTIMNTIVENYFIITTENLLLDNINYTNHIIQTEKIKICVLDFEIIRRDPISDNNHYGMHINIDNVGGTNNFLKYFYEKFNSLPKTCRCAMYGKDCIHIV